MQSRSVNHQTLQNLFRRADTNNNGQIDARELQGALSNGLNIPFNINVVTLMIKMFDRDYSGHIEFNEFANLFTYVDQWKTCFQRFDTDGSGFIDAQELHRALCTFRYNLSIDFIHLLMRRFDRTRRGQMAFDDFIHACVCLQGVFRLPFIPRPLSRSRWAMARPVARAAGNPSIMASGRIMRPRRDIPQHVGIIGPAIWLFIPFYLPCLIRWSDPVERWLIRSPIQSPTRPLWTFGLTLTLHRCVQPRVGAPSPPA
ncbi:uncharacterized protein DEA37_0000290 [Paragonimus westermani]|uniref:EF-hand domain-containing protein n=1 Tax=Paragonimus westermani TaxID=34504 RepID=A0A5J4NWD2_9TREM|nr:uncharacterized protein DEA37_0000290 [Paragonimus westermani]